MLLVCLAALYYLAAGTYKASHFSADFIPVYSGARCFVQGCNPYDPTQLQPAYLEAHGNPGRLNSEYWQDRPPVYPPSTLLMLSPLALLPFPAASVVWALLGGTLFLAAIGLVLSACPQKYFWVAAILACIFLLADSPSLLGTGNPATFACSLAVAGAVLFLRDRYIPLAVVLLTVSLATKPQIAGFVVLYFLARKIHWRGAVLAMGASVAILLIAGFTLQGRPGSRNWMPTLRASITESIQPGHVDDPSPANVRFPGLVNLQTITSTFIASPKVYNAVTWAICLGMFAVWMVAVRRTSTGGADHFLALPALLVLSLLPVYHRGCDDLLLLLAIPLVLKVMEKNYVLGGVIAVGTALLHLLDIVIPRIELSLGRAGTLQEAMSHKLFFLLLLRYECILLLLLFGLYLAGMYVVQGSSDARQAVETSEAYSV